MYLFGSDLRREVLFLLALCDVASAASSLMGCRRQKLAIPVLWWDMYPAPALFSPSLGQLLLSPQILSATNSCFPLSGITWIPSCTGGMLTLQDIYHDTCNSFLDRVPLGIRNLFGHRSLSTERSWKRERTSSVENWSLFLFQLLHQAWTDLSKSAAVAVGWGWLSASLPTSPVALADSTLTAD